MDITSILKRSWEITKAHRYLWWLGILAIVTQGSGVSFPTNGFNWHQPTSVDSMRFSEDTVSTWIANHLPLLGALALVAFVIYLVVLYVSYSANAGLILAVDNLEGAKKSSTFGRAYHAGRPFVWRLFGMTLLAAVITFGIIMVAGIPSFLLLVASFALPILLILSIPILILVFTAFMLFTFYMVAVVTLAQRRIVLDGDGPVAALSNAHHMAWKKLGTVALLMVAKLGVTLVAGIVIAIVVGALVAIAAAIGFGIHSAASAGVLWTYISVVSAALLVLLLIISGILSAFHSSYWTIAYRALRHIEKAH